MAGIFSRIISGEIPAHKIAENEYCFAFLDVKPLVKGHTLVVPKQEIDYLFDIPEDLYNELFSFAKVVAKAIYQSIPCIKVGMSVIGLEVPHAHIHLVPMNSMQDLNFSNPRLVLSPEEYKEIATAISSKLA